MKMLISVVCEHFVLLEDAVEQITQEASGTHYSGFRSQVPLGFQRTISASWIEWASLWALLF